MSLEVLGLIWQMFLGPYVRTLLPDTMIEDWSRFVKQEGRVAQVPRVSRAFSFLSSRGTFATCGTRDTFSLHAQSAILAS